MRHELRTILHAENIKKKWNTDTTIATFNKEDCF
jgi:hypothetical protein